MEREESNHKFARIKELLKTAQRQELLYDEFLQDVELENLIPVREVEKIVEVVKPPKCSPKQLEYQKQYRLWLKEQEKETEEQARREAKIEKAKKRMKFICSSCNKIVFARPENNTHELRTKRNQEKPTILIKNVCPKCNNIVTGFGGYLY